MPEVTNVDEVAGAIARELGKKPWQEEIRAYKAAERAVSPIDIKAGSEPAFFPHINQEAQNEWSARASLVSAAAYKKLAPSYDKLFPNEPALAFSKAEMETLLEKEGVVQSLSVYIAILADNPNLRTLLGDATLPENFYALKDNLNVLQIRSKMEGWLQDNLGLDKDQAEDAEHIAWNFLYISNAVEWNDSQFNGRQGPDRLPPIPGLKSLTTWMMMHPEERLSAKVSSNDAFGAFGEWALDNMRRIPGWTPAVEDILPDTMFPTVLHGVKTGGSRNLYDFLLDQGRRLHANPTAPLDSISWDEVGESPFSKYYFDVMSPAIVVFTMIDRGETEKKLKDIGTACRKLGLTRKYRETILLARKGVDSNSRSLKMAQGDFAWKLYLNYVKKYAPNFFD